MFEKSARFYDAIYSWKDYDGEVKLLRELIRERCKDAASVLDVACGTGKHLEGLVPDFQVEGLDLDPEMVAIARGRLPGVEIHEGDMASFELSKQFDAVLCLFSSIAYAPDIDALNKAIARMARHLRSGGVLIVEPWLSPEEWDIGSLHALFVDEPDLKIARINNSSQEERSSILDFNYLVGTSSEGVTYFQEQHRLTLFTHEEYMDAFRRAGIAAQHDGEGLMGRGLYLGSR
jgi:SAM-dependent methyltransferase